MASLEEETKHGDGNILAESDSWQACISKQLLQILWFVNVPLNCLGLCIEHILNVFIANNGVLETFRRLIFFGCGKFVIPERDTEDFVSIVEALDPRSCLFVDSYTQGVAHIDEANSVVFPGPDYGARDLADVLVMSSKLAYENKAYIKKVVNNCWKMNFVESYECWNEYHKQKSTKVFIFTDRRTDARAIVVAWRGTELFNTLHWSTDFDFAWYKVPGLGRVHVGFLEALGLADRTQKQTLNRMISRATDEFPGPISGLPAKVLADQDKIQAFDQVTEVVKKLMDDNEDAKLFVTGHSLGGALAGLYTTMLYFKRDDFVTGRLAAVYTFGQPRLGDDQFCEYMIQKITIQRFWRVVYSNDLVPRIPFDDHIFQYRHAGYAHYYDAQYRLKIVKDIPYPNYFSFSIIAWFKIRVMALYELFVSLFATWIYGSEYRETLVCTSVRALGVLFSPGIAAHIMNNYVNATRLGTTPSRINSEEKEK